MPAGYRSILHDVAYGRFRDLSAERYAVPASVLDSVVGLLESGCTVPFIVRYRGFLTGTLDAEGVFALNRDVASFSAVVKSRDNKLLNLRSACRLTPGAEQIFHRCLSMHDLDEAWAPYKETKLSKLSQILEVPGMCQLASDILQRRQRSVHILPMGDCRYGFEEALLHVLSERIGREDVVVTEQALRTIRHDDVYLAVKLKTAKSLPEKYNQATCKYKQYHNALGLNLGSIRDHQVLAIRRGHKEGILSLTFSVGGRAISSLRSFIRTKYNISADSSAARDYLGPSIDEAIARVLGPSRQRAEWQLAVEKAEGCALAVFCRNLRNLLLTPPLQSYYSPTEEDHALTVLGVDPGFNNGHKLAVISPINSMILATGKMFSSNGKSDPSAVLQAICRQHNVKVIAIGDGVGSAEAQLIVEDCMRVGGLSEDVSCAVVSEAGASVYSVSPAAKEQHPDIDISYLGAVSIARRLLDPLSELVKIPPESLGIGMYQHDLVVSDLSQRLSEVIEECVNTGGVDLNACSAYLLTYLSGMNTSRAKAVIAHRDQHGKFASVAEIKKVKGIGDVTFRNAAGFLRVYGGLEVLDATAVHPDHYDILRDTLDWAHVEFGNDDNMLERKKQKFDVSKAKTKRKRAYELTAENIGNAFVADLLRKAVENVSKLPPCIVLSLRKTLNDGKHEDESSSYIDSQALSSVINNWIKWLAPHSIRQINHVPWASDVAPGKPPVLKNRATLLTARQRTADIKPGSVTAIEGTIKNIVPFGAFVDVGMSNDGLLHRTQFLPDHQNIDNSKNDSYCAYRMKDIVVGQRVHVFVLSITPPNRIALGFSPPTDSAKKYAEVELGFKSNTPDASLSIPEISAKKRKRFDIARNP